MKSRPAVYSFSKRGLRRSGLNAFGLIGGRHFSVRMECLRKWTHRTFNITSTPVKGLQMQLPIPNRVEFDRPTERKPFGIFVIHQKKVYRSRVCRALFFLAPVEMVSTEHFVTFCQSSSAVHPGVVFCDVTEDAESVLRSIRKQKLPLEVVILSDDAAAFEAIQLVRWNHAAEWILKGEYAIGRSAIDAARRAYCRAHCTADLAGLTPSGEPVVAPENIRQRFRCLTVHQRRVLQLLARGIHRINIGQILGTAPNCVTTTKCRIQELLDMPNYAELIRLYLVASRREHR